MMMARGRNGSRTSWQLQDRLAASARDGTERAATEEEEEEEEEEEVMLSTAGQAREQLLLWAETGRGMTQEKEELEEVVVVVAAAVVVVGVGVAAAVVVVGREADAGESFQVRSLGAGRGGISRKGPRDATPRGCLRTIRFWI
jgi:hypothetical protein